MSLPAAPPEPPPPRAFDLGSALLILVGVILLLPGICALFSALSLMPFGMGDLGTLVLLMILWAICLAISYGGIKLIRRGVGR